MDTKQDKRKQRNQRYYQKRKKVEDEAKVTPLFPNRITQVAAQPMQSILIPLILLSAALSTYLCTETINYFQSTESGGILCVLKALLVESVVLVFSILKFQDFFSKVLHKFVLVGMCAYSLWAMSSNVLIQANKEYRQSDAVKLQTADLENQIQTKKVLVEKYIAKDWLGVARTNQTNLDVLQNRLSELRRENVDVRPPAIVLNTVLNCVLFRLILLIANILCVRRLKELWPGIKTSYFQTPSFC